MKDVDYSEKAIELRIRQVSELRKLCLSLAKAKEKHEPSAAKPEQRTTKN